MKQGFNLLRNWNYLIPIYNKIKSTTKKIMVNNSGGGGGMVRNSPSTFRHPVSKLKFQAHKVCVDLEGVRLTIPPPPSILNFIHNRHGMKSKSHEE